MPVWRSARRSHLGTHLHHVHWSGALGSDQVRLVPGVAAQCPRMLFCDLYHVKLDCLRPPSPSRQSLSLSQETELHNLIIHTIKIAFLLDAKCDHVSFSISVTLYSHRVSIYYVFIGAALFHTCMMLCLPACMHDQSLSRVRLFVTPWTVAHQAPLSMGFSRQEYLSGLPGTFPGHFLLQGIFPTQRLNPGLLR